MEEIHIRNANISATQLICKLGSQTQLETFLKDNIPSVMNAYIEATFNKEIIKKELNDSKNKATYFAQITNLILGGDIQNDFMLRKSIK